MFPWTPRSCKAKGMSSRRLTQSCARYVPVLCPSAWLRQTNSMLFSSRKQQLKELLAETEEALVASRADLASAKTNLTGKFSEAGTCVHFTWGG